MTAGNGLAARLRATFVGELEEQVRTMNAELLALEHSPGDPERLKSLFRVAHTVKGAARAAAVPLVEQTCHALEALLAQARDGRLTLSPDHFALLFAAADALAEAGQRLRAGDDLSDSLLAALHARLTAKAAPTQPPRAVVRSTEARVEDYMRVRSDRVDELLAAAQQVMVARSEQARDGAIDDLLRRIHRLRMRPFSEACEALPRTVRDLASASGKDVQLIVTGGDVEADRGVLDGIREALLHLVRNAVAHGLEDVGTRLRAGKPAQGRVTVAASLHGDRIIVTVSDDGAGLNLAAIRARMAGAGMKVPDDDRDVARALFHGGLSTQAEATPISGRGVGLDLVRAASERVRGSVDVAWNHGQGTVVTLQCPPTLASVRAVLATVSTQIVAVPTMQVERLLRVRAGDIKRVEGRDVIVSDGSAVALVPLAAILPPLAPRAIAGAVPVVLLVSREGDRRLAVAVDELLAEEEVVLHPLQNGKRRAPLLSGAAMLRTGRVALVLDADAIVSAGLNGPRPGITFEEARPAGKAKPRILVVDDSITTRTLEQSVLEAAGYDAVTAVDGADAWRALQERGADLVVADVEMPRMDGFALSEAIRSSKRFTDLPIVLVTALESPEHRARGLEVGADAYIGKSSFDQRALLDIIEQLLGRNEG